MKLDYSRCGNCKFWGKQHEVSDVKYCQSPHKPTALNVLTPADASCPRHAPKKAEIPETLKNWHPTWHPASEEPPQVTRVLAHEDGRFTVLLLKGNKWLVGWNHDEYFDDQVDFWCELP
jgi:hypothetical protein